MIWHKEFRLAGIANSTVYDMGLESTEKEPKTLISLLIQTSGYADNDIEGWLEKTKVFDLPDYLLDTDANTGSANQQYSAMRVNEIPVQVELGIGERFKVALRCGATPHNLKGAYVYEIKG